MAKQLAQVLFVAFFALASCDLYKKAVKPDDIPEELYCMGCQLVVKELDFILSQKPTRGMGETVTRALHRVCDEANFKKYEYNVKKINKICKALKMDEGLEAVLIKEYGQKHELRKKIIANDLAHMICKTVVKACPEGNIMDVNEEDGGLVYDAEKNEYVVKEGQKVKRPNPVPGDGPRQKGPQTAHKKGRKNQHEDDVQSHDEL